MPPLLLVEAISQSIQVGTRTVLIKRRRGMISLWRSTKWPIKSIKKIWQSFLIGLQLMTESRSTVKWFTSEEWLWLWDWPPVVSCEHKIKRKENFEESTLALQDFGRDRHLRITVKASTWMHPSDWPNQGWVRKDFVYEVGGKGRFLDSLSN